MIWKLFKLLSANLYNFGVVKEGFKKGPKGIAKSIGIILLVILVLVEFFFLFGTMVIGIYTNLKAAGSQEYTPVVVMLMALIISFFFGFLSTSVSYYTGSGEEQLMALPLTPRQILSAKFLLSVLSELPFGSCLICIGTCVYGYMEGLLTNPGIYVGMIVTSIISCMVIIALIYLIFVLLLTVCPALRKKSVLQGIATVFLLVIAMAFGFINGASTNDIGAKLNQSIAGSPLIDAGSFPIIKFFASSLTGNWLSILSLLAIGAVLLFGFMPLLGKLYLRTLNGFSDIKSKKINNAQAEKLIHEDAKRNSVFKALYLRDIKTVFREPVFFSNGPLSVFLIPLIFVVTIVATTSMTDKTLFSGLLQIGTYLQNLDQATLMTIIYCTAIGAAAFSSFMASMSNIAATSFSREGKAIHDIQAMPIEPQTFVLVKIWHSMTYTLISNIITTLIIVVASVFLQLDFFISEIGMIIVLQFVLSFFLSLLLVSIDMLFDTINPKLNWENPMAAIKQNLNAFFSMFTNMILIALLSLLFFIVLPKNILGFIIAAAVLIILSVPLAALYFKFAVKKFPKM